MGEVAIINTEERTHLLKPLHLRRQEAIKLVSYPESVDYLLLRGCVETHDWQVPALLIRVEVPSMGYS